MYGETDKNEHHNTHTHMYVHTFITYITDSVINVRNDPNGHGSFRVIGGEFLFWRRRIRHFWVCRTTRLPFSPQYRFFPSFYPLGYILPYPIAAASHFLMASRSRQPSPQGRPLRACFSCHDCVLWMIVNILLDLHDARSVPPIRRTPRS